MEQIIVTGIYTENYKDILDLQIKSCKDDYLFDFRFISDEEWNKNKSSSEFAFFDGNTLKTQLVIDKIREYWGKLIIVSDADVVFLKKTKKQIQSELFNYNMLFLKERRDTIKNPYHRAPANINIGFVVIKCNNKSLEYWETVQNRVISEKGWDQEISNQLLANGESKLNFNLLSDYFLNGGDITPNNLFRQMIGTSCGTIASRNNLSKLEYLNKLLNMSKGKEKYWFDGKTKIRKYNRIFRRGDDN